jgi:glycine betaine/proline transport system substrate-binding protein
MATVNQIKLRLGSTKKKIQSKTGLPGILFAATLSVLLVAAPFAYAGEPGAGKTVRPSRANWDTFWFGEKIVRAGLEKLGYTVKEPKTLNSPARWPAVAQGDVDYSTDAVMPNATPMYEKTKDRVALVGPIMQPGSIQGYLIDKKSAEKHGITNVNDMKKPEIAKVFDSNGDGKADLVGCNPGWGCARSTNHHMEAYKLGGSVNHIQGEYNLLVADAVARYKRGDPVFLYAWYPNTATVQMVPGKDLVWLQVPFTDLPGGAKGNTTLSNLVGCASGPGDCNVGMLSTSYYIVANKEWLAENPAAKRFLELIKMDISDRARQNTAMMNGEDSERDLVRHAQEWIASHQAEFDGWIAEARKAAK